MEAIASRLAELEARYRRIAGDTAALAYLSWLSRGQFGEIPAPTTSKMTTLSQRLLTEAYPDARERAMVVGEIEWLSPARESVPRCVPIRNAHRFEPDADARF